MPCQLDGILAVIGAPSIRDLTLVRADFRDFDRNRFDFGPHSSSLTKLKLWTCSFDERSISQFLSIPKALADFSFSPLVTFNRRGTGVVGNINDLRHLTKHLLVNQSQHLKHLYLDFMTESHQVTSDTIAEFCLSSLNQLSKLDMVLDCRLSDIDMRDMALHLPKRLTHLKICECRRSHLPDAIPSIPIILSERLDYLPSLQQLDLELCRSGFSPNAQKQAADIGTDINAKRGILFQLHRRGRVHGTYLPYYWEWGGNTSSVVVYNNLNNEDLWESLTQREKDYYEEFASPTDYTPIPRPSNADTVLKSGDLRELMRVQ